MMSVGGDEAQMARKYPRFMRGNWTARLVATSIVGVLAGIFVFALARFELSLGQLGEGVVRIFGFVGLMLPPSPGTQGALYLQAMAETVAIAFLGTLVAAIFAFPLGLLAARNVLPNFLAHFLLRRSMDAARSVDTLIWALIWINVVGLGPFAGILAIATTDIAPLAKLFGEALENADNKSAEGIVASGGGSLARVRFGLLPQTAPVMASQVLYFFESNTRSATIVGIVGAGGIGLYITEAIRTLDWDKVAFQVVLILIAVAIIDALSSKLRRAMGSRTVPL